MDDIGKPSFKTGKDLINQKKILEELSGYVEGTGPNFD
jgi:hypothetical protein